MMACTLCKLVSGDNKIPLNTYADFKKSERETWGKREETRRERNRRWEGRRAAKTINSKSAQKWIDVNFMSISSM